MRRAICAFYLLLCLTLLAGSAPAPAASATAEEHTVVCPLGVEPELTVRADSILLIERDSGQTIYEKDADARAYPASTTKIMTALCVVNAVADLDAAQVLVQQRVLDQLPDDKISLAGLMDGEQLTVRQLLYCLLLPSGNDAALVLADYVSGGTEAFAALMNATAAELGCQSTHFDSPNGLSGQEHYTTARDMARIAEALLQNELLAEIVRTPSYVLTTNVHNGLVLENTNHLLDEHDENYHPAVTGVKTGSSTLSGRCLIASAEQDGLRLLCVIMGAPYTNVYGTIIEPSTAIVAGREMYDWAYDAFTRVTLTDGLEDMRVAVRGVGAADVRPAWPLAAVLPADRAGQVARTVTTQERLRAPLQKGQAVGQITYTCGGEQIAAVPLVMDEDVAATYWWMWPLPVAVGLAALSVLARLRRRRGKRRPAPADAGVRGRSDHSPFVDYDDRKKR